MQMSRIEELHSQTIKQWSYDRYIKGDLHYSADRPELGSTVAVISLSDTDRHRFSPALDNAEEIIMHHRDFLHKQIDDATKYRMIDIIFKVIYED
jgi:hypothetical protein